MSWLNSAWKDSGVERMPPGWDEAEGESSMWRIIAMAGAATGVIAIGVAGLLLGWESWALIVSVALTAVLMPSAIRESVGNRRRAAALLSASRDIEAGREDLEDQRKQLASQAADVEKRAASVERQYQILTGLVDEKKSKHTTAETAQEFGLFELQLQLDAALGALREREEAERLLTIKVTELQSARNRAEQELSRLMAESYKRLTLERQSARFVKERRMERAAEEVAERRSVAEKQAEELLAEARARARTLLAEAEEEAERLSEQGREEFESALRELQLREEEETEQAGQVLADARAKAERITREAEERAETLVAQGEAEFESILEQIREYEARERELYEKLLHLESNGSPPGVRDDGTPPRAAGVEASSPESDLEAQQAEKALPYLSVAEAADRGFRSPARNEKPSGPGSGATTAVPDLVLPLDSDDDSSGPLRRLLGSLRRRSGHDAGELPYS